MMLRCQAERPPSPCNEGCGNRGLQCIALPPADVGNPACHLSYDETGILVEMGDGGAAPGKSGIVGGTDERDVARDVESTGGK